MIFKLRGTSKRAKSKVISVWAIFDRKSVNFREVKREEKKRARRIISVDEDTGEYKEKRIYIDRLLSTRGYVMKYNTDYIKIFFERELPKELSDKDCGRFYRLMMYIVGNNQMLGYRTNKGMKPLTVAKMADILNCTERQVKLYIKKLNRLGIIKGAMMGTEKWYVVNPLYALKGKYLTETAFFIFEKELREELPRYVIDEWLKMSQSRFSEN